MKTFAHNSFLRFAHKTLACLLAFCMVNVPVWAISNGDVIGTPVNATVNITDNVLTNVTLSQNKAIINWRNLDTLAGENLNFSYGAGSFAVLNRVLSNSATRFDGNLNALGGHVLIINQHGILFGPTASISADRFTASSLNILDNDFLDGAYKFTGDGIGKVENYGDISAEQVALIGKSVLNAGTISSPDGYTILAAGDRVFLNPDGSDLLIEMEGVTLPEMPSAEGLGDVINEGTIEATDGQIVLGAGDIYSLAIEGTSDKTALVESGSGRVGQFGTLNAEGSVGDGGSITLTAGDTVVLGENSITTANAGLNGNGGSIVVYSPDTALFRRGGLVEAKGGTESGNGGFFEISGKQCLETMGSIDLTGSQDGTFLIDPLDLWVVDDVTIDVTEDPDNTWKPVNDDSVSQLDVDDLEAYLDVADVTLSTLDTPYAKKQDGDIIFDFNRELHSGASGTSDNSLIVTADHNIEFKSGSRINFEGSGSVELYASTQGDSPDYNGSVISYDRFSSNNDKTKDIWTRQGNIIIEAGGGGKIDLGILQAGVQTTNGSLEPGEIRLYTINGTERAVDYEHTSDFDIIVQHLGVYGKRYSSIYVESAGDIFINGSNSLGGAIEAYSKTSSHNDPSSSFICLIADGNIDITGDIKTFTQGAGDSRSSVWLGAGTNVQLDGGYEGSITVNGNIESDVGSSSGAIEDATIRLYASEVTVNGTVNALAGDVQYRTKNPQPEDSGLTDNSDDPINGAQYEWDPEEQDSDPDVRNPMYDKLTRGTRALVDIDIEKDGSCLNCENKEIQVFFSVQDDLYNVDWDAGYTIVDIDGITVLSDDPAATFDVLENDGPVDPADLAISEIEIVIIDQTNTDGLLVFDTSGEEPKLNYIPPSYDKDFTTFVSLDLDGDGELEQYATFEEWFTYQVRITTESGRVFMSENTAQVTITVLNEVPTLEGAEQTIHMNTTADFDLSTLVTDPDGTPGNLLNPDEHIGTYGTLNYDIVEGLIPVQNGNIETDSTLIPDTLTIADDVITYAPLDGYVSPAGKATTFGYTVTDDNITGVVFELPEGENLSVTVTNTLPGGTIVLDNAPMNAYEVDLDATGGFSDAEDEFVIVSIDPATDDENVIFGGTLTYNGSNDPYAADGDYTYSADTTTLPGYVGEDNFDASLWDGQRKYFVDGTSEEVYGTGYINLTLENDRPQGDVWLGTTTMDTEIVGGSIKGGEFTDDGIGDPVTVVGNGTISSDDYNNSFGGTLNYNEGSDTFDYDPTTMGLPGYTGDNGPVVDNFNDDGYVISENADDRFDVLLWDGENDYTFLQEGNTWVIDSVDPVYGNGTVSVDITNTPAEGDTWFGVVHMNSEDNNNGWTLDEFDNPVAVTPDFGDVTVVSGTYSGHVIGDDTKGGTLVYDADTGTWNYTTPDMDGNPATKDGYVGNDVDIPGNAGYLADDVVTVDLSNGEYDYWFGEAPAPEGYDYYEPADIYRKVVTSEGTVAVDIFNLKPTGSGDLGTIDFGTVSLTVTQLGTDSPLKVEDVLDAFQRSGIDIDELSIVETPIAITGDMGGTLLFEKISAEDGQWTYIPAPDFVGTETFNVKNIWDGENIYDGGTLVGPAYGTGVLTVTVAAPPPPPPPPTPEQPVAPLPLLELPELKGCPVEMDAAAAELGINSDELQLMIANSMATNPNLQPCDACQNLLTAAAALQDPDGIRMAALAEIFSTMAPADAPFTPEVQASVVTAFAEMTEQDPQYALAAEYIDAFVNYVAVVETDLKVPVGDPVELALNKYGSDLMSSDNPNMAAFITARIEASETFTQ